MFEVIPAIDLRDGKCVRLMQGDYDRETVFSDDPAAVAARWTSAGARLIHVVDLDGAAAGRPSNLGVLRAIRAATSAVIEYGGGLRDDAAVEEAMAAGADRVVVGTALISRPEWVASLCERYGGRVVAGIDARDGRVATNGWRTDSSLTTSEVVQRANDIGLHWALFTDISRDGTLEGPNLTSLRSVVDEARFSVIASGGVARLEDIEAIKAAGARAVILGRAIYTGRVDLAEAIALVQETTTTC
ncbi:MAG: hisA 1 [Chloroflexi bacterium]|nr:hisA 1 [Chloroflexota bacterium]